MSREIHQHIELRDRRRPCVADAPASPRNRLANFGIEAALDFKRALFGRENFALVFLQFGRT